MVKTERLENRHLRQNSDEPPVIEDPILEKMDEALERPKRVGAKKRKMAIDPPARIRGKNLMNPIPTDVQKDVDTHKGPDFQYPPQEEFRKARGKRSRQKVEGYLRLRLQVQDGNISLTDVHKVDGPLVIEGKIDSSLVYEVLVSSKRVAIGSITDVGFNRSFPNPKDVPGQEGHLFVEVPSYEFYARLPTKHLSFSVLPKMEIVVYRMKTPIERAIGEKSLALEFGNELREVARLKGINIKTLSKRSQAKIHDIL
jgi:hypothetical protein